MRIFASILIMLGANAQRFDSKLMCCLESQNGTCYEELTACIQASRVVADHCEEVLLTGKA